MGLELYKYHKLTHYWAEKKVQNILQKRVSLTMYKTEKQVLRQEPKPPKQPSC